MAFRYELSETEPTGFEWKEADATGGDTGVDEQAEVQLASGSGWRLFSPNDGAKLAEAGQRKGEEAAGDALADEADFSHKRRQ